MFSIVMPLFNKEPHVARSVESVLRQSEPAWELIVVDDGSTDGGAAVVRSFADQRIRYLHQENQGPSEARNRGIAEARYPLVAFLDADDEWLPGHLETMRRLNGRFPQAAIYSQAYLIRKNGTDVSPKFSKIPRTASDVLIPNYFASAKPGGLPVWTSVAVLPKAVLQKTGGFPRGVPRGQDLECWSLAALEGPVAFSHEVGGIYYTDTVNRHDKRRRTIDRKLAIETALEEGRVPGDLVWGVKLYIQRLYVRRYEAHIKAGALAEARALRRTMGRGLAWDTLWRIAFLDLRRVIPFTFIEKIRKARGA